MRHFKSICLILCLLLWLPASGYAQEQQAITPIIGVSGSSEDSTSVQHIFARLHELGAYPIFLNHDRVAEVAHDASLLHGVIIGGNRWDINPADYNEPIDSRTDNEDANNDEASSKRGTYEYALLDQVFKQELPFLGICSGMQRLNVANHANDGGKLKQHVDGQRQYLKQFPFDPKRPGDTISVLDQSGLSVLARQMETNVAKKIGENSLHHQVIDPEAIRRGFRVSAISAEHGTIEAIEPDPKGPYANLPIIGVQWHPEYGISPLSRGLFADLVAKAKARAQKHPVSIEQVETIDTLSPQIRREINQGVDAL